MKWRPPYRDNKLAQPLRTGERPEDKLRLLLKDLGVTLLNADFETEDECRAGLLAFRQRHGPTRCFPSPPRLRGHEPPEDMLRRLMQHYGASTYRACLLAAAIERVRGFQPPNVLRTGGPTRTLKKPNAAHIADTAREISAANPALSATDAKTRAMRLEDKRTAKINVLKAAADEAQMIELIDQMREKNPRRKRRKLERIAYDLAHSDREDPNDPSYDPRKHNPFYGRDEKWIVSRYTNLKRYQKLAEKRIEDELRAFWEGIERADPAKAERLRAAMRAKHKRS